MTESKKPYKFYVDGDPIVYAGATSAEKVVYKWIQKDGDNIVRESEEFFKAKEAKLWIESECWEDEPKDDGWERIKFVKDLGLQVAKDATDEVVKDYIKTGKKFCRKGKEPVFRGWLTESGQKEKDVKGLEDKYQFNRLDTEKPKYHKEIREYILETYPWITMAKKGYEADTHVVGRAEMAGEDGCTLSIDKDIDQVEGSWHVNMNDSFPYRKCYLSTELGDIWQEKTHRGKDKTKGDGFKWLCYQAIVGDVSDGYKGLYGVGDKAAVKLLEPCKTKEECVKALESMYLKKSAKGCDSKAVKMLQEDKPDYDHLFAKKHEFKYISWDYPLEAF